MAEKPELNANKLCYKDTKHWVVQITDPNGFELFDNEYDYVIWDLEEGAGLAVIKVNEDGRFVCWTTLSAVDYGEGTVDTFAEAIEWAEQAADELTGM